MPLYSGGGGGGGSGLVEGTDPNTKNNSASDAASASTINSFARPCRNRVCPTVMSTGRYRGVTGVVRVFLIQDIGDNFSVFARLAREEPPETSFTIEEHNNQRITCTDETETRKAALADAVLGPASAGVLRRGQSVTAVFVDGTDTWVIQKSGSGTTLANVLGGSAVPNSATGRCAGAGG